MTASELLVTLKGMLYHNGIRMHIIVPGKSVPSDIDYGFRQEFSPDYCYDSFGEKLDRLIRPEVLYHFQDDLLLYYSIFCFYDSPEKTTAHRQFLVIGPFITQSLTEHDFNTLAQKFSFPQSFLSNVHEFYNRVPLVPSPDFWNCTIFYFVSRLCDHSPESRWVTNREISLFLTPCSEYDIPEEHEQAVSNIEERYLWESNFMDAVSHGDQAEALKAHSHFLKYRITPRIADSLRNRKNMSIILNTLLRKAAQSGKVHPVHIDNLSRQFSIEIESASSLRQLNALSKTMIIKYCMLVKNYAQSSYSQLVSGCVNYIDFHFAEDVTLKLLSQKFSVSESHLSRVFRHETGMVLTEYLNRTRIRQALYYLGNNKLSITQVALKCGFSSATYFGRVFKKQNGMTPKEYQKSIHA